MDSLPLNMANKAIPHTIQTATITLLVVALVMVDPHKNVATLHTPRNSSTHPNKVERMPHTTAMPLLRTSMEMRLVPAAPKVKGVLAQLLSVVLLVVSLVTRWVVDSLEVLLVRRLVLSA